MIAAELITVIADIGDMSDPDHEADVAGVLTRFLEGQGVPVRGWHAVVADEALVERSLRHAIAGGGLVVGLAAGDGAVLLRRTLARILEARLVLSERALEAVAATYAARGRAMPRRAEGLALVPHGTTVLVAADGGEPGLLAEVPGALVALLPGAAALAVALVREHLLARLPRRATEPVTVVRTLRLVGLSIPEAETRLADALVGAAGAEGRVREVDGEIRVRLALSGPTAPAAETRFAALEPALRTALGAAWYGTDDETLELVVGRLLRARGLTVALAESCTGGLVGHRLTQVAGSSAYLERGFVVYSNAAKQALLGVAAEVLTRHGAVSAACAEAMAVGARRQAGTDLAVSITGIAGPDGGTPQKPVGTVFVGLADRETVVSRRYRFARDREGNKLLSAVRALDAIRRYCLARP